MWRLEVHVMGGRRPRLSLLVCLVAVSVVAATTGTAAGAQSAPARCFGQSPTIVAEAGVRTVGTAGPDVIVGTSDADVIIGGGGDDRICAGAGDDRVVGGAGNDRIDGGSGDDTVLGKRGNDRIRGSAGLDMLVGGGGGDVCRGGPDATQLRTCERVGGTRMLRKSDFAGTWDVTYGNPRFLAVPGPCRDRTLRFESFGFFMFLVGCGEAVDVGNFTPAEMCLDEYCGYPFSFFARWIGQVRRGSFVFTQHPTRIQLPPTTTLCTRPIPVPGRWRLEVTAIDGENRATEFVWRDVAGNCATVYGETSGWVATFQVTVIRQ